MRFWVGNDSANEERSIKDAIVRDVTLRAPCVLWNRAYSERKNAGARKMTLLPMFRSLSVNQGYVQRDRFLNSLADW
jgi:hypothetical protein